MSAEPHLKFGPFTLLPVQRLLLKGVSQVRLGSRAMDILIALVERQGMVVAKSDLMSIVWPTLRVVENNITVHIAALRRSLGDGVDGQRYIVAVPARGYSFVAPVSVGAPQAAPPRPDTVGGGSYANNLPFLLTRLIGRRQIIGILAQRLRRHRLLTVVGPGGVGKTSVAMAAARAEIGDFENGVWLVDLAPVQTGNLVANSMAAVFGVEAKDVDMMPAVVAALRDRRMLIVLDNCEHVLEGAARLVSEILRNAPQVQVLATCREPLKIEGENVFHLSPLECPPEEESSAESIRDFPAVRLFIDRASARATGLEFSDLVMPVVAAICRRLDGMPLAIEFAAAYAGTLGVAALATRLEDRLSLLSGRRNAALERHHTLQATHDLSYGLLDEGERAILRRLAVFTGKFTVEAAARVGADASLGPSDAIDRLADLVQKSLVTVDMGAPVTSYRLLHTTRAYASQKLLESGEGAGAASRHAAYHADLLLRAWEDRANLFGAGGYDLYKDQIDDIRAALEWAFSPAGNLELGIRLSAGASICFIELGMMIEARDWSQRGLDAIKSAAAEPQCERLLQYGLTHSLVITRGNIEVALKALLKTLKMTQAAGDADLEMRTLGGFHIFQTRSGAYNGAMTTALRAADVAAPDDPEAMAMAAGMLAQSYHFAGDQKKAEIYCRDCLRFAPLSQRVNTIRFGVDQRIRAQSVNARLLWLLGRPDQALDAARAMVAFGLDSGDPVVDAMSCDYAINVAFLYGDWTWGEQLVDRIDRLGREHLIQPYETLARRYRSELAYRAGEIDGLREQELAYQRVADIGLNPAFPAISLIEGLIAGSRFAEAQALISDIKARMLREGQSLYAPEYDRMQGKVFAAQGDAEAAILAFEQALSLARAQSALGWELRASIDLACLLKTRDPAKARLTLEPVFQRYGEGFASADLRIASQMLESMP